MTHLPHHPTRIKHDTPDGEAERLIHNWDPINDQPTSFRDPNPPVPTGAQPVPQPDSRIVPPLATGTAVVGIGIGTMAVGIGAGTNLAGAGAEMVFNSVTSEGLMLFGLIFASPLVLAASVGIVVSKLKAAAAEEKPSTNNYYGTVNHTSSMTVEQTNRTLSFGRSKATKNI